MGGEGSKEAEINGKAQEELLNMLGQAKKGKKNKNSPLNSPRENPMQTPRASIQNSPQNKRQSKRNSNQNQNQNQMQKSAFQPGDNPNEDGNQHQQQSEISQPGVLFDFLPEKYRAEGQDNLNVTMVCIKKTPSSPTLTRADSTHSATLSWRVTTQKIRKEEFYFLQFELMEENEYFSRWKLDEQGQLIEGDPQKWQIIAPFSGGKTGKVGGYDCVTSYTKYGDAEEKQELNQLQQEKYKQWGEAKPLPRLNNQISSKQQEILEYRELSKYFAPAPASNWSFTLFYQEKNNAFTSWLLQNAKQTGKTAQGMRNTLRNDIGNRSKMYIKEMKTRLRK